MALAKPLDLLKAVRFTISVTHHDTADGATWIPLMSRGGKQEGEDNEFWDMKKPDFGLVARR